MGALLNTLNKTTPSTIRVRDQLSLPQQQRQGEIGNFATVLETIGTNRGREFSPSTGTFLTPRNRNRKTLLGN